jgi:hypothetical protein
MMLCFSNHVLPIFTTSNHSLHGIIHPMTAPSYFFRNPIDSQKYVDADHQLKMPGNAEHIL